jgi:hypothetical protein
LDVTRKKNTLGTYCGKVRCRAHLALAGALALHRAHLGLSSASPTRFALETIA